jgi:hypothetical protein
MDLRDLIRKNEYEVVYTLVRNTNHSALLGFWLRDAGPSDQI